MPHIQENNQDMGHLYLINYYIRDKILNFAETNQNIF